MNIHKASLLQDRIWTGLKLCKQNSCFEFTSEVGLSEAPVSCWSSLPSDPRNSPAPSVMVFKPWSVYAPFVAEHLLTLILCALTSCEFLHELLSTLYRNLFDEV